MAARVIALVDDDPFIIGLLDDLLSGEGYRTLTITQSAGASAAIARDMPDLVILDLWMETRNAGWSIYHDLRANDATARIPIILCSADVAALREHMTTLTGPDDAAVEKPFNIADILATVARLLGES